MHRSLQGRLRKLVQDSAWPGLDQAAASGGAFLTIVLCARGLAPVEQGKLAYAISAYGAAVLINAALIFQASAVLAPRKPDPAGYHSDLARLQLAVSTVVTPFLVVLLYALPLADVSTSLVTESVSLAIFMFVQQLADFDRKSAYVFATPKRAAMSSFVNYGLRVVLLIAFLGQSIQPAFLLLTAAALVPALAAARSALQPGSGPNQLAKEVKEQFAYARWLLLNVPFALGWGRLPIYIAGGVLGIASAGVFLTIRSVTNAANVGLEIIENYFAARLAREYVSDPERYRKTLAELVIIVLLAWLVGLFLLHAFDERILAVVSNGRYTGFGGMLLAFWVANFAIFVFRIQAIHLRTTGRHVYIPIGYAVGAIVLVSSFALVFSVAGLQGLANAVVLGASAIAIFQALIIWRRGSHES